MFEKLLQADMVCRNSEVYGASAGLTKKSGEELSERNFTLKAKVVEIGSL